MLESFCKFPCYATTLVDTRIPQPLEVLPFLLPRSVKK